MLESSAPVLAENKKEDIFAVPPQFRFRYLYMSEIVGPAGFLVAGLRTFAQVREFIQKKPLMTVDEFIDAQTGSDREQLESEVKRYPKKFARLDEIIRDINTMGEKDGARFKILSSEAHQLITGERGNLF